MKLFGHVNVVKLFFVVSIISTHMKTSQKNFIMSFWNRILAVIPLQKTRFGTVVMYEVIFKNWETRTTAAEVGIIIFIKSLAKANYLIKSILKGF